MFYAEIMSATINGTFSSSSFDSHVAAAAHEALALEPGVGYERVANADSSSIKIIVVGAGFAGLACAIECRRKGHSVIVLEKFKELKILGAYNLLS